MARWCHRINKYCAARPPLYDATTRTCAVCVPAGHQEHDVVARAAGLPRDNREYPGEHTVIMDAILGRDND